jgi:hypothetical protein
MTGEEFEALLSRRAELREQHQAYCDDVNGPLGTGERSPEASGRDRVWGELQEIEAQIDAALEAERAEEDVLERLRAAAAGEAPIVMAPADREVAYLREALSTETDPAVRARMQARLDDVLQGRDLLRPEPS